MRSGLGRQGAVLVGVFDVDEVDLHALLGLDADDEGRTLAGSDDFVGVVDALDKETISTLKLVNDGLGKVGEADLGVLVVEILGQLGNALGIGLGLEPEALALEQGLQFFVVGDDSIVHDGELPGRVGPVGVAVHAGRGTVGCPPGVGNTAVGIIDLGQVDIGLIDELPELCNLADLLEGEDLLFLVPIYRQTSRIVSSVFETGESLRESEGEPNVS